MKKVLAITTGLSLLLLMFSGMTFVLAHSGNSGSGSSGDEEADEAAAELRIRNDGEVDIKDGEVTDVDLMHNMFDVSVQGMTFMVHIMPDTEFNEEDADLMDLMEGDTVEVEGMVDAADHHLIHADEVKVGEN